MHHAGGCIYSPNRTVRGRNELVPVTDKRLAVLRPRKLGVSRGKRFFETQELDSAFFGWGLLLAAAYKQQQDKKVTHGFLPSFVPPFLPEIDRKRAQRVFASVGERL